MNEKQRLITAAETRVRVAIRNARAWQHDVPVLKSTPRPCTAIVPYTRPLAIVPAGFWK